MANKVFNKIIDDVNGDNYIVTDASAVHTSDVVSTYSSTGTSPVNGTAIAAALDTLDVSSVGGAGKYISAISEENGKISATATSMDTAPTANSTNAVTSGGVKTALDTKASTTHTHSSIVTIGDTRDTATKPNDYNNKFQFDGIKRNSTINNPSSDAYSYVFGLRGWSNESGGNAHELAFNNNGLFLRQGSTTEWGNWGKVLTTTNVDSIARTIPQDVSKGANLVVNGSGTMMSNYNFSTSEFIPDTDLPTGVAGCFHKASNTFFCNEKIAVNTDKAYKIESWYRVKTANTSTVRLSIACYDIDNNEIQANTICYSPGTLTQLTQDLKPGDTVVHLADLSGTGWTNTTEAWQRGFIFWDYKNSYGYQYPPETYSRHVYATKYETANVNVSAGTITLNAAWTGTTFPAGTYVSRYSSGSTYYYAAISSVNAASTTWSKLSGIAKGYNNPGTSDGGPFRPGTAFIRVGWVNANTAGNEWIEFAGIELREIPESSLKLTYARKLKTNLARTADSTFDGSADQTNIPVTGTLPIANGGTGQTTAQNAANALLSGLPTWTQDPNDNVYLIRRDTGGSSTFGQVKFSTVWNYVKGKLTSDTGVDISGNAATASAAQTGSQLATDISGKEPLLTQARGVEKYHHTNDGAITGLYCSTATGGTDQYGIAFNANGSLMWDSSYIVYKINPNLATSYGQAHKFEGLAAYALNSVSASDYNVGGGIESALNGKQATLATQTAYQNMGSATTVPQITTNSLGQVTGITEVTITGVAPASHTHGSITNDGKIGSTADLAVVTGTSGAVTTADLTTASPSTSGISLAFVDTVSQDSKGKIAATKKNVTIVDSYSSTGTDPVSGKAVADALGTLDVSSVGGSGKYISAISESDGKISATATTMDTSPTADSAKAITSGAVYTALGGKQDTIVFDGTYDSTTNKAATVSTVTGAVNALDATKTSTDGTNVQVKVTEENGKITAVNVTTDNTASSTHTHGNISNDGKVGTTADYAVVTTTGGAVTATSLATSSPSASGNTLSFIDTVSQNSKGKITATKKSVTVDSTYSASGTNPVNGQAIAAAISSGIDLVGSVKTTDTANGDTIQFQAGSGTAGEVTIVNSKHAASADAAGKLATARKAYVTLGTASTTTTVDWSADPTTIPVNGTLKVSNGGTGMTTATNVNSVVIGNSTTANGAMQTVRTGNGAFYATAQDGKPQFGTLPVAQGGTGLTSSPSMLVNLGSTTAANVMAASPRPGVTGTLPIGNGGTGATSAADARTNLDVYSKSETESLLDGKIEIVASYADLPATGTAGVTYYVKVSTTGDDQYDEYIWGTPPGGSAAQYIKVGEHSLDLSGYKTKQSDVNDPTSSGTALNFIATISQNDNGVISATKSKVTISDTYSSTGTNPVSGKAIAAALDTLDVSSTGGAGKYISAISETNGKISATATSMDTAPTADSTNAVTSGAVKTALDGKQDTLAAQTAYQSKGSATKVPQITTNALGQVTGITEVTITGVTPASHPHGNITNGGALQTTDVTIATGDKLVITDSSDSGKVARSSVEFDGSTTTKALTPKGTFETFSKLELGSSSTTAAAGNHAHGNITNGGALQTTDITIASGDKLVVTDSSNSNKVARTSVSFDGSTTTTALTPKGTFETFSKLAIGTTADTAAAGNHAHGNITNDGKVGTTADYAVVTTTGGAVTATSLATTSPTESGDTIAFIDTVSQNSKGKITATKKTVSTMGAASADTAGTAGLVPAPAAGNQGKYLKGDGTWGTPTNNAVKATDKSSDTGSYPILAVANSTPTSGSNYGAYYDTGVTLNPSTNTISANISGTAATATDYSTTGGIATALSGKSDTTHGHGNITNAGAIGTTSGYAVYTTTDGVLTAGSLAVSDPTADGTTTTAIATISQDAKGKITVTKKTISGVTPASHTHGNIQNGGTLQTNDVTIASGDKLVITDSSDSSKVARASVSFDGSTTTTALTPKGTFEAFAKAADITTAINNLDSNKTSTDGTNVQVKVTETDGKISAVNITTDTTANKNEGVYYVAGTTDYAAWAANTTYAVNDQVISGGKAYSCTTAHTSGTSFDSSKWTAMPTPVLKGTISGVTALYTGMKIAYKWPITGGSTSTYLNINGLGNVYIRRNNSEMTTHLPANSVSFLTYDGTYWRWADYDYNSNTQYIVPDAYCNTAAGTAAKTATCEGFNYSRHNNIAFRIYFTVANTSAGQLTLNLNSQGAKNLWINGANSSSSNYTIAIGVYWCYYDGTQFQLWTDKSLWAAKHRGDGSNLTEAFTAASSRANIATGESNATIFGKIAKWFGDLKGAAFMDTGTSSTTVALGNHGHGNITNGGALQTNDITIATGDKLVVTDASDSNKVARTSVAFDGSTISKALTQKGTFESVMLASDAMSLSGGDGVDITFANNAATVSANITPIPTSVIEALS